MRFRLRPGWPRLALALAPILFGLALLAAALLVLPALRSPAPALAAADGQVAAAPPPPAGLLVDVSGAVAHPGLYRLARGERVQAAIRAAGGLSSEADPAHLPNLAGLLKDGEQVKVPARRSSSNSSSGSRQPPVDLNTAPIDDLQSVPGFTPELAQAVIDYRTQFGGFQSTRELVDVLGMGEAQYLWAKRHLRT